MNNFSKELQRIEAQLAALEQDQHNEDLEYMIRSTLKESFYLFVRLAWSEVDSSRFIDGFYIEAITEHLEALYKGEIRNLLINLPPRHSKSTICSILFPVWVWLKNPTLQLLCASYNSVLSIRDAVKSRSLLTSPWFKSKYGDEFTLSYDNNRKDFYSNNKGGTRISTSVGGSGTGFGYDICSIDDPHKASDVHSKAKMENTIEWFFSTMSTRANDPKTSRMMVIMQRLSKNDLAQHLIDQGEFEVLKLPMEYIPTNHITSIGWRDPRSIEGELLSPGRYNRKELEKLKKSLMVGGYWQVSAQLQQEPIPVEGRLIPASSFNFYSTTFSQNYQVIVSSWDLATGIAHGDYSVGQVWGYLDGKYYLLDVYRGKETFDKQLQAFETLNEKWKIHVNLIEKQANAQAMYDLLQRRYKNIKLLSTRDYGGNKESRFLSISHLILNKKVHLPKNSRFTDEFLQEVLDFPRGANDDQVDAFVYALSYLDRNYGENTQQKMLHPDMLEQILTTGRTWQEEALAIPLESSPIRDLFDSDYSPNLWQ